MSEQKKKPCLFCSVIFAAAHTSKKLCIGPHTRRKICASFYWKKFWSLREFCLNHVFTQSFVVLFSRGNCLSPFSAPKLFLAFWTDNAL